MEFLFSYVFFIFSLIVESFVINSFTTTALHTLMGKRESNDDLAACVEMDDILPGKDDEGELFVH